MEVSSSAGEVESVEVVEVEIEVLFDVDQSIQSGLIVVAVVEDDWLLLHVDPDAVPVPVAAGC